MTGESKLNYWQQQEMFSSPPLPERLRSLAHFAFQRLPGVKRLRGGGRCRADHTSSDEVKIAWSSATTFLLLS